MDNTTVNHNGYEWCVYPNDYKLNKDSQGRDTVGAVYISRSPDDKDLWQGTMDLNWYSTYIELKDPYIVMTLLENSYELMTKGLDGNRIWEPQSETVSTRTTLGAVGVLEKHDKGCRFTLKADRESSVDFKNRRDALMVGNLVLDSYLKYYKERT